MLRRDCPAVFGSGTGTRSWAGGMILAWFLLADSTLGFVLLIRYRDA